jgi:hypothetical protein
LAQAKQRTKSRLQVAKTPIKASCSERKPRLDQEGSLCPMAPTRGNQLGGQPHVSHFRLIRTTSPRCQERSGGFFKPPLEAVKPRALRRRPARLHLWWFAHPSPITRHRSSDPCHSRQHTGVSCNAESRSLPHPHPTRAGHQSRDVAPIACLSGCHDSSCSSMTPARDMVMAIHGSRCSPAANLLRLLA